MLLSLIQWAKKVNINKHHLFLESGTEAETFKEMLEDLICLSERYENPWFSEGLKLETIAKLFETELSLSWQTQIHKKLDFLAQKNGFFRN